MGGALAELSSEGLAWLPTVANLITLSCFGLSLLLNTYLTQVSNTLSKCPADHRPGSVYADALPQASSDATTQNGPNQWKHPETRSAK